MCMVKQKKTEMRGRTGYLGHKICTQDEGLIGFGTNLSGFVWSSGHVYPSRDVGEKHIPGFGYIFVR